MSEQQTAIDEHIAWLEEQRDEADADLRKLSKHHDDDAARGVEWGRRNAFREAIEHALKLHARERQQG